MKKGDHKMIQKAAIAKALDERGGRARLIEIYPRIFELSVFKEDSDKQATIRATLQRHPEMFRRSPGKPKGWWELVSYQEEVEHLKAVIAEQNKVIEEQKKVPTEDDFIQRLLEKLKTVWKDEKKTINEIRKILDALGRSDVVSELDNYLESKKKKPSKQAGKSSDKIVVNGSYYAGDHVTEKTVIPSVSNYKPQITTQTIEATMPPLGQQEQKQLQDE